MLGWRYFPSESGSLTLENLLRCQGFLRYATGKFYYPTYPSLCYPQDFRLGRSFKVSNSIGSWVGGTSFPTPGLLLWTRKVFRGTRPLTEHWVVPVPPFHPSQRMDLEIVHGWEVEGERLNCSGVVCKFLF